ncbi:polysaccharide biosynthesis protein [Methylomonas koyamae]|uniref:Polysaccharide biosynthesis protein n=1 Tax=Methylomonas koyamae TaxID=702114 RepID=A0A177NPU3_9GAMM|nr:lipopolysaccharide biosynthesis protein [Methylomonas koyamae]OAI19891.1 polysaccharide biosynthesis protein [Methylomonas koyamae]
MVKRALVRLRQSRLCGDAFWALLGQLASALALLLGTRLLTERVAPDVYGEAALLSGCVALGVAAFSYPFICAGMRLLPECAGPAQRSQLQRAVAGLTGQATLLALSLLLAGGGCYAYLYRAPAAPFLLAGALLAVTVWREFGVQLAIGGRRQRRAALWQTGDSVLRPALAVAAVGYLGARVEWILAAYAAATLLSNLLWCRLGAESAAGELSPTDVRRFAGKIWRYAWPLLPMELLFWLNGVGDRYAIAYLLSAADVGLYAAGYTLVNEAFNRSAMVLLRTFQPAYFQAFSGGEYRRAHAVLRLWLYCLLAGGGLGLLALPWLGDWLVALLLAEPYRPVAALLPAIGGGCLLHALGTLWAQPLLAEKRTRLLLKGRLCGALAAITVLPLLILQYGLPGAAWANPVYFGIEALVLALLAKPWRLRDGDPLPAVAEASAAAPLRAPA